MMEVRKDEWICAEQISKEYADTCKEVLHLSYAYTWAPNPKYYPSYDPVQQYNCCLNSIFFKQDLCKIFDKFLFTPELTESGNIHIHGYYTIKDLVKYHRWFLPACKSIGFVLVKSKVNETWTSDYVVKDANRMEDILGFDQPIPLHSINYPHYRREYGESKLKHHFTNLDMNFVKKRRENIKKYL